MSERQSVTNVYMIQSGTFTTNYFKYRLEVSMPEVTLLFRVLKNKSCRSSEVKKWLIPIYQMGSW